MWGPEDVNAATGTITKRAKYSAFDGGWRRDFDAMIDAHIAAMVDARKAAGFPESVVLHDFRKHNSMAPAAPAAPSQAEKEPAA